MNDKRPLIYLAAAVIVVAVVYFVERPSEPRIDDSSYDYLVDDFDVDRIDRFEVRQLQGGAAIRRGEKGWLVSDLATEAKKELTAKEGREIPEESWRPADSLRVEAALSRFGGLQEGLLVSDNADNRPAYRVDASGVAVRALDPSGKELFDLVIGKNGPDLIGTYVRRAGEDDVWLVGRPLFGVCSPRAADWEAKDAGEANEAR